MKTSGYGRMPRPRIQRVNQSNDSLPAIVRIRTCSTLDSFQPVQCAVVMVTTFTKHFGLPTIVEYLLVSNQFCPFKNSFVLNLLYY